MLASVGNQRVMLRVDDPGEGDDSKETNIAVGLPATDATGERRFRFKIMRRIWSKAEDAEQQRNVGTGSTSQANQDHRRFEDPSRGRRV